MIDFDKGVPLPDRKWPSNRKYWFDKMEVGDSFVGAANEANALHVWCRQYGWTFTRRRIEGEPGKWRFWRVT